jgi:hypothetical protein
MDTPNPLRLEWSEVETAAKAAFNVWVGAPELAWAEQAWRILEAQGLTDYSEEFERHTVAFRFLALGGIYRDFCSVYWEETTDRWYSEWAVSLELSPLILGQLYGQLADEPMTDEESEVLTALGERERKAVVDALRAGFGGNVKLYESLARSREPQNTEADDDHAFDHWETTWQNSAGYEWVCEGCQPSFVNE